jgi:hypothetical protein
MSTSDAFALKNSGLNEFLFAEIGTEANGSPLTTLSMLARLGLDPWTEAARLSGLPKTSVADCLVNRISQMPLCPDALTGASTTAARLILLLPSQDRPFLTTEPTGTPKSAVPAWFPLALFLAAMAFSLCAELMPSPVPANSIAPLTSQAAGHPDAAQN